MSKISLKKIFIRILMFFGTAYMIALILSIVLVIKMSSVVYESTAFGIVLHEYKLDFMSNRAGDNSYDFNKIQVEHKEIEFSSLQELKFKTQFAICFAPLWRKTYANPFIMDGDQWNITRIYGNEKKDSTYGSNAYPLMYPFVLRAIKGLFI